LYTNNTSIFRKGWIKLSLQDWYDKGISKEAYMAELDTLKDGFHTIYKGFSVPDADLKKLHELKHLRVIVLAEVWCGHCMLDVPILLRTVEAANIPVRFLPRDRHLSLMDQYLTNDKRFIPIFIFIDENGKEVGKWGPMAPAVKAYVDELKQDVPAKDDPTYEEKFKEMIHQTGKRFTEDQDLWKTVYEDIKTQLLTCKNK